MGRKKSYLSSSNISLMKLVLDLTEVGFVLNTHFTFRCYPLVLEEDQIVDFHLWFFLFLRRASASGPDCCSRAAGAA